MGLYTCNFFSSVFDLMVLQYTIRYHIFMYLNSDECDCSVHDTDETYSCVAGMLQGDKLPCQILFEFMVLS